MREKKYHIYLTAEEQSRVIQSLIRLKMSFSNKADILTQWMMFSARYWQPRRSIIYSSNQIAQNIRGPPTPKCKRSFLWEYYPYKLEFIFSYMSPQLQPPKSKKQSVRVLQTRIQTHAVLFLPLPTQDHCNSNSNKNYS